MDSVKKTYRDVEQDAKEKLRDVDGHDVTDDLGNAGDELRKNVGNAGDELRRSVDDHDVSVEDETTKERPYTPMPR